MHGRVINVVGHCVWDKTDCWESARSAFVFMLDVICDVRFVILPLGWSTFCHEFA